MRRLQLLGWVVTLALCLGAAAAWLGRTGAQTESDQSYLARLISDALSTPDARISIGALDGALSSDATLRNLVISDRDGVWLKLDRARLVWNRAALLSRRLQIDKLEIGRLDIFRSPASGPARPGGAAQPLLPEPPVKIIVSDFSLAELGLGAPVLGVAARFSSRGAAQLGDPSEGLKLTFDLSRLDAPGRFAATLGYVPRSQALDFSLGLKEEPGGLLSKLARLPGEPAVTLDLVGKGKLDAFAADLAFAAGPAIGARGQATLKREGAGRRLGLALQAEIAGLLPEIAAAVFPGATRLDGDVFLADDGALRIARLALDGAAAELEAKGDVGADKSLKAELYAGTRRGAAQALKAGAGEIRLFALNAVLGGKLSAPQAEANLSAEGVRLPQGALDRLTARLTTLPAAGEPDVAALSLEAQASGVAPADPALAKALGGSLAVTAKGKVRGDGAGTYEAIHIAAPHADFTYSGELGAARLLGRLNVHLPDLAAFDGLAGVKLAGNGQIAADLEGAPRDGRVAAKLDGALRGFAVGVAPIDRLTGGEAALAGTVRTLGAGGFGFDDFRVVGRHAALRAQGEARQEKADVALALDIPDLRLADPRLAGKGALEAFLTGSLAHPDGRARLTIADGAMLGRPARLALALEGRDLTGQLDAQAVLDGQIDGKPARGGAHLAREAAGWRLDGLDVAIGSVSARGAASVANTGLAAGHLALAAKNLDDLSPLLLTRLAGQIDAALALDAADGRQNAKLTLKGAGLRAEGAAFDRIEAQLAVADAFGRASLNADASVNQAQIAGESVSNLRLTARGDAAATDVAASAKARGFDLSAKAKVAPGETLRIDLASLEARGQGRRIALASPAAILLHKGEARTDGVTLALDGGRLTLAGRAGSTLDMRIAARAVPLALADLAAPGLGLSGALDGEAALTGTPQNLAGAWRATLAKLSAPQIRNAGLPPIDVKASGVLQGARTNLDAVIALGKAGDLRVSGAAPLAADGALDVAVKGTLDSAVANASLAPAGRRVNGVLQLDFRVAGRAQKPQISGAASMSGGGFSDALQGVRLKDIAARVTARGEEIVVEQLSAATNNGGSLAVAGHVRADPAAGFPGAFKVTGKRAELIANGIVTASADLALELSGALARNPRIAGRVDLTAMEVRVPTSLPGSAQPLGNVRHLNPPRALAQKLAAEARARAAAARRGKAPPPFNASLDIALSAPGRIFVRGRGIDAELGGDLRIGGALARPIVNGAFALRRGRLAVLGKRLDFTRANIVFNGDFSPELDFLADAKTSDVAAHIGVTGSAAAPAFAFTSEPALPQDEVLSRILFDKPTGSLSTFQALLLAQSAAEFAGGGDGAFEKLRRSLGVDSLDVQAGANGPSVGASRAISDNVSVGVKAGATPAQTGLSVDVDLTRNIRVQGEVSQGGAASLGLGVQYEY